MKWAWSRIRREKMWNRLDPYILYAFMIIR